MKHAAPVIILVRPQIAENIGATARAMANFGLTQLRLVSPQPYDVQLAAKVACHGRSVLAKQQVFPSLEDALKDCVFSIATSRRVRRVKIEPITPKESARRLVTLPPRRPSALVFGAERTGLTNEEIFLCDTASSIPTAKDGSLNLGQAVLLYLYEWFLAEKPVQRPDEPWLPRPDKNIGQKGCQWQRLATHQEKQRLFDLLETLLIRSEYKPITRLPEFIRRIKYLFENRPLNYRENQIFLKLLRYLEKLTDINFPR